MKKDIIFLDIDGVLATEESSTLALHEQFAYPLPVFVLHGFNFFSAYFSRIIHLIIN